MLPLAASVVVTSLKKNAAKKGVNYTIVAEVTKASFRHVVTMIEEK